LEWIARIGRKERNRRYCRIGRPRPGCPEAGRIVLTFCAAARACFDTENGLKLLYFKALP